MSKIKSTDNYKMFDEISTWLNTYEKKVFNFLIKRVRKACRAGASAGGQWVTFKNPGEFLSILTKNKVFWSKQKRHYECQKIAAAVFSLQEKRFSCIVKKDGGYQHTSVGIISLSGSEASVTREGKKKWERFVIELPRIYVEYINWEIIDYYLIRPSVRNEIAEHAVNPFRWSFYFSQFIAYYDLTDEDLATGEMAWLGEKPSEAALTGFAEMIRMKNLERVSLILRVCYDIVKAKKSHVLYNQRGCVHLR